MRKLYDTKTKVDTPEGYTWQAAFNNVTLGDGEKLYHKWQIVYRGFMWERSVTDEECNDEKIAGEWKAALSAEADRQHVPEVVQDTKKGN